MAACLLVVVMTVSAAGCGSEKKETGKGTTGTIKIATKPMTEQYILGEMLKQLIENKTDYKVEVTKGIGGGTSNIHPAMEKGEFDLYPEYTSSGWVMVLGNQAGEVSDDEILEKLQKEYQEKFQMTWLGLYGFNNTYALAVSKKVADKYQLKNCSDLAKVSKDLVFGGNPDYIEREDGFPGVCKAYGLEFKNVKDIDKIEAVTEEKDPNGNLNKPGGYTTQVYFSSPLVKDEYGLFTGDVIEDGTDCGGSVEVYKTVSEAKKRNDYLSAFDGGILSGGAHTVYGSIIIRTSGELTASQQKALEDAILNALTEL